MTSVKGTYLLPRQYNDGWEDYLNTVEPFFKICKNKEILEIGPFQGHHTELIKKNNPKSLTLVEANTDIISSLQHRFPEYKVVNKDIFEFVENVNSFDIVVCCGVLYHFHSPIYLLEKIVNNNNPEYVIIESVFRESISYNGTIGTMNDENDNTPGARYVNKKSAKINIVYSVEVVEKAMSNLGYSVELKQQINSKLLSKKDTTFLIFKQK